MTAACTRVPVSASDLAQCPCCSATGGLPTDAAGARLTGGCARGVCAAGACALGCAAGLQLALGICMVWPTCWRSGVRACRLRPCSLVAATQHLDLIWISDGRVGRLYGRQAGVVACGDGRQRVATPYDIALQAATCRRQRAQDQLWLGPCADALCSLCALEVVMTAQMATRRPRLRQEQAQLLRCCIWTAVACSFARSHAWQACRDVQLRCGVSAVCLRP